MHLGAQGLELVDGPGQPGLVDVRDGDEGAAASQVQRDGPADAGAGARDDDDLVPERPHAEIPAGSSRPVRPVLDVARAVTS